ncbi:MAG: tRNA pseudouridine(55) synthase TruB [Gemmatimonadaceae bacterium]
MSVISTDALLLVDKPQGVTSHDVVASARRALGTRRVGHAGTLDPFATGLLILLAGKGTRLIQFVPTEPKVYEATVRFGTATDTDDVTGVPVVSAELPDFGRLSSAIRQLTGEQLQLPPPYSAKHVGGTRAYALARRGETPELKPVPVTVHAWDVLAVRADEIDVRISCGTGTYVRALARDLGRLTGSAAHLKSLRRISSGPFSVEDAQSWESLRNRTCTPRPLTDALVNWPAQRLDANDSQRITRGMRVDATIEGASRAILTDAAGKLLAIALRVENTWQPQVVLADA